MGFDSLQTRRHNCRRLGLLFTLLCGGLLALGHLAPAEVPQGVFSLSPAGVACREVVLANPSVDGISIRQDWKDLEPTDGVFNWSFLDAEVARTAAAGKQILLRINTQANKPAWLTDAVVKAGGDFFTFDNDGVQTAIPVFWDPTFLAGKKALIAALGAHFANNAAIKIVSSSFANSQSEDWSAPHTPSDIDHWVALGYTSAKLLDAGKQIIDATMAAFPQQYVTLAVGGSGDLDPDESYVARNAVLAARETWPGRLIVQKNNLSTFNPLAPGTNTLFQLLWDSRPDVGGQMLDASYADSTFRNNAGVADDAGAILHRSINLGAGYGMKYIEIYQLDVLNLTAEIAYAHKVLWGLLPPSATLPEGIVPNPPSGFRLEP